MRLTYIIFVASFLIAASNSMDSHKSNFSKKLKKTKLECVNGNNCEKNIESTKIAKKLKKKKNLKRMKSRVTWIPGQNWARDCDFVGKDKANVLQLGTGANCGSTCANYQDCTHFVWTNYLGGTCWLKYGPVSQSDAIDLKNQNAICGIIGDIPEPPPSDKLKSFTNCQFTYGRDFTGKSNTDYSQFDYITVWLGYSHGPNRGSTISDLYFDPNSHGAMLDKAKSLNKIPVFYAYIIAFSARYLWHLNDCNVPPQPDLCHQGANYVRRQKNTILNIYDQYSSQIANKIGSNAFCVFLIEPDFYQYHGDPNQQGGGVSGQEMASLFDSIVSTIKSHLPNAAISWDISPWLSTSKMNEWWGYFKNSQIDFLHTSGGQAQPNTDVIVNNQLSYSFMTQLTGKKIIADTGYGVGGEADTRNIHQWLQSGNIDSRVANGVISITTANTIENPTYHKKNIC